MSKRLKILVTGGPTRAYLDDVRFLTNYSTGELAREICEVLTRRGDSVSAVFGPTAFDLKEVSAMRRTAIETNPQMLKAVLRECREFRPDYVVFAAAVLDFTPGEVKRGKTSSRKSWTVELVPTPKIIEQVRKNFPRIRRVGFKLEAKKLTGRKLEAFAADKIAENDLHALCLNFFSDIVGKKHRAEIFLPTGHSRGAIGKRNIAQVIARTIK